MQRCFAVTAAAATKHLLLPASAPCKTPDGMPVLTCLLLSHFLDPIDEELRTVVVSRHMEPCSLPSGPLIPAPRIVPPDPLLSAPLPLRRELRVLALHNCHLATPDASLLVESLGELCPGLVMLLLGGSLTSSPAAGLDAAAALTELAAVHLPKLLVLEATMHNFQGQRHVGRSARTQADSSGSEIEIKRPKSAAAHGHIVFWDMCDPDCVAEAAQVVLEGGWPTSGSPMENRKRASIARLVASIGQETALVRAVRAAVNCSGPGRLTPTHLAAESGDAATVSRLLRLGADVDARDTRGATPLFLAAEAGHAQVAKALLGGGAQVMMQNNGGENALYIAALKGHMELIHVLIVHCNDSHIDWQDPAAYGDGWTPLMAAAVAKRCDMARFLISASFASLVSPRNADVDSNKGPGSSPCSDEHGGGVSAGPLRGQDSARAVGGEGARIRPRDDAAVVPREVELGLKQPDAGSHARPKSTSSLNPAAKPFCMMPVSPHSKPAHAQLSAAAPCVPAHPSPLVAAANRFGQTTLHIVARRGFMPMLGMLLEAGASATARDSYGFTAGDVAGKAGREDAMRVLKIAAEQAQAPSKKCGEMCSMETDRESSKLNEEGPKSTGHHEEVVEVAPGCRLTRRRPRGKKGRRNRSALVHDGA